MILVLSNSAFESSTDSVCDWLLYLEANFFRLNIDEIFNGRYDIHFDIVNDVLTIADTVNDQLLDFNDIKIVWSRRKSDKTFDSIIDECYYDSISFNRVSFARFLSMEKNTFLKVLLRKIDEHKWLDDFENVNNLNKIQILKSAISVGLSIPQTFITNNIHNVNSKNEFITKPIFEAMGFLGDGGSFITHTKNVGDINIKNERFIPSLFQTDIQKKYELRIFYLNKKFFAMAIFSSENKRTKTDFRAYDYNKPNRTVPYKLPELIKNKIIDLMTMLRLNHGSIDMIYTTTGEYIFLEVNPIGQFGMVSYPCRYFIEREIAVYLNEKSYE